MATEINREVAQKVSISLVNADMTKLELSDRTGIPYSTLHRKLRGRGDFSFEELFLIASVLGVRPSAFVPNVFSGEARVSA